jgi:hypothetical protein
MYILLNRQNEINKTVKKIKNDRGGEGVYSKNLYSPDECKDPFCDLLFIVFNYFYLLLLQM